MAGTTKKFRCEECDYYWEIKTHKNNPENCPVCGSSKIHQSARHQRFAKKSRQQLRRSFIKK
jgi:rubrerythrin